MKGNPFSLDFGSTPSLFIPRINEMNKIVSTYNDDVPSSHIFMILGARGNGKTVLMSAVTEKLVENDSWIHVDLSPESDMMNVLAAELYQKTKKRTAKLKMEFSLDLKIASAGVSAEKENKYTSVYTDLNNMLELLQKKNLKLLVTVDEAYNSKTIREFTSFFQHCLREKYPVFLLMTGLYKNIRALQNDRSQTFLKRAPRIVLGPLNIYRIEQKYKEVFELSDEEAAKMAMYTNGYSYAFQVLGYLLFESGQKKVTEKLLVEYRMLLGECSYDKIWEELSGNERLVAITAAGMSDNVSVKEVREAISMNPNEFSTYSDTLEKSGIFSADSARGRINFALPYIKEFVQRKASTFA